MNYHLVSTICISVIFFVLMGLLILQNCKLLKKVKYLEIQNESIRSLGKIYYSMHLIDIEENTVQRVNAPQELDRLIKNNSNASKVMEEVMRAAIVPEYMEQALEFTNLSTLPERLKDKNTVFDEFKGINNWIRGRFIVIDRTADGKAKNVIFATVLVDTEKKKEEGLIHISLTDELTELKNRRAYEDALHKYNEEKTSNITIISFDVNGLKKINDTMGHVAGDELLVAASDCMVKAFSPYGDIFRTGGDEFVAFLTITDERLKQATSKFNNLLDNWVGKYVKKISVSYGICKRNDYPENTIEQIVAIADEKMYEMKKAFYDNNKELNRRKN